MAPPEPGKHSGTTFQDIMPIPRSVKVPAGARLAQRLCNFDNDKTYLLLSHMNWLNANVWPLVSSLQGPWIDLIGHASRWLGPQGFREPESKNIWLSIERCKSVRKWVENYSDSINWNLKVGQGSADTVGDQDNNDGYWRAVDIYVYGFKPPTVTVQPSTQFEIRFLASGSGSALIPGLDPIDIPLQGSGYWFQIVDKQKRETAIFRYTDLNLSLLTASIGISAASASVSTKPGPPKQFRTTEGVALSDFEGDASLYQTFSVTVPAYSYSTPLYLNLDSNKLLARAARIIPDRLLEISTPSGFNSGTSSTGLLDINAFTAGGIKGTFTMVSGTRPFAGY